MSEWYKPWGRGGLRLLDHVDLVSLGDHVHPGKTKFGDEDQQYYADYVVNVLYCSKVLTFGPGNP